MHETYMDHILIMYGSYMVHVWPIYGTYFHWSFYEPFFFIIRTTDQPIHLDTLPARPLLRRVKETVLLLYETVSPFRCPSPTPSRMLRDVSYYRNVCSRTL